jgi:hypothetical protein
MPVPANRSQHHEQSFIGRPNDQLGILFFEAGMLSIELSPPLQNGKTCRLILHKLYQSKLSIM